MILAEGAVLQHAWGTKQRPAETEPSADDSVLVAVLSEEDTLLLAVMRPVCVLPVVHSTGPGGGFYPYQYPGECL